MNRGLRVSVLQMSPTQDKDANIAAATRLIDAVVAADHPDLVALPEVWSCLGGTRATKFSRAEQLPPPGSPPGTQTGPAYQAMRAAAQRHRIHLHGGSIIERDNDRLFNTSLAFAPDGTELARYRKLHLFDVITPDGAGYRESDTFGRGDAIVTYSANDTRIGCTICYDLRFPPLFAALRLAGADLIMVPSAFTQQTGRHHWEPLLRARAIDTQCWIAAPATVGPHHDATGATRLTWGHAMICDPWGTIVAQAGGAGTSATAGGAGASATAEEADTWATADIDPTITARVRRDMPLLDHRQPINPPLDQPSRAAE